MGKNNVKREKKKHVRLKYIMLSIFTVIVIGVMSFLIYYFVATDNSDLSYGKLPLNYQNIQIFDRNNQDVTAMYYSNYLQKEEITDNIKIAFLTTEDRKFYNHNGVDYKRIIGAAAKNISHGSLSQGGSTITQQLIKNTHLSSDKNLNRKLKELKLAYQLENNFSKDEILSMYLNVLYFGNGIYGINNAAKAFFDKKVSELNLAECCMLAGIVKNPSKYSPQTCFHNATDRKNLILMLVKECGIINDAQYHEQLEYPIKIANNAKLDNYLNSYLTNAIYEAKNMLGLNAKEKLPKGLKIYTNIDPEIQKNIDEIVVKKQGVIANANGIYPDNAIILVDNVNGGVLAFSGSYKQSQYGIFRQSGSTAKPFSSYLPALENKLINVATPIEDKATDFNGYSPKNYKDAYHGWVNMKESLAKSYNIPAVKVLESLGVNNSKAFLSKINWKTTSDDGLAIALGGFTEGQRLSEIAGAYSMLASYGVYKKPHFVNKIELDNRTINNVNAASSAASKANAYLVTDCLKSTVKDGTLRKLSYLPYEIAGKTGTVAAFRGNTDSYSASYTSEHTLVVWQGNLSNKEENNLPDSNTGGSYPTTQAYMVYDSLYKGHYPAAFYVPEDVIDEEIDVYTLEKYNKVVKANPLFPDNLKRWEKFSIDNTPTDYSTIFNDCELKNVLIDYSFDSIKLTFEGKEFVGYEIYKTGILKDTLLANIENKDGNIEFIDNKNNGLIKYSYIIRPYIRHNEDAKIYLKDKVVLITRNGFS